jgi:hypothetical protein
VALTIELAAVRLRMMSVTEVASRLDDRFRLLTGGARTALPRQRTLEATVAWSDDLLASAERLLFDRLTVFAGGFSLGAAERVCADEALPAADVLELTSRLVERSMVTADQLPQAATRYGLLETLRQFGRQKLVERAETEAVLDRHLARAAELAGAATGSEQLREEEDNLRAALDSGAEQPALRIAARQPSRHFKEYARRDALLLAPSPSIPAGLPGEALLAGGELAFMIGDWTRGAERCAAAAAAGRAAVIAREGIRVTDEIEDVFDRAHLSEVVGFVLCLQGRFEEAADQLAGAASLTKRVSAGCSAHVLEAAAAFAAMTDRLELGAELLGAATRIRGDSGDKPRPWERAVRTRWLPLIPARLEPTIYAAATERGSAREFPEALDFAEIHLRASHGQA